MAANSKRETLNRLAKVGPNAAARNESSNAKEPSPQQRSLLSVGEAAARLGTDKTRLRAALSHGQILHKLVPKRVVAAPDVASEGSAAAPMAEISPSGRGVRVPVEILDELRQLLDSLPDEAISETESMVTESHQELTPALVEDEASGWNATVEAKQVNLEREDIHIGETANNQSQNGTSNAPVSGESSSNSETSDEETAISQPLVATPSSMPLSLAFERLLGEKDARIDDLKAEIAHLREVLEREQGSHARTQALLSLQAPSPEPQISGEPITVPADPLPANVEPQKQMDAPPRRGLFSWFRSPRMPNV